MSINITFCYSVSSRILFIDFFFALLHLFFHHYNTLFVVAFDIDVDMGWNIERMQNNIHEYEKKNYKNHLRGYC